MDARTLNKDKVNRYMQSEISPYAIQQNEKQIPVSLNKLFEDEQESKRGKGPRVKA